MHCGKKSCLFHICFRAINVTTLWKGNNGKTNSDCVSLSGLSAKYFHYAEHKPFWAQVTTADKGRYLILTQYIGHFRNCNYWGGRYSCHRPHNCRGCRGTLHQPREGKSLIDLLPAILSELLLWSYGDRAALSRGSRTHTRVAPPSKMPRESRLIAFSRLTKRVIGQTPLNPQQPCGGYKAGPVFLDRDKIHIVSPESVIRLSAEFSSPPHGPPF